MAWEVVVQIVMMVVQFLLSLFGAGSEVSDEQQSAIDAAFGTEGIGEAFAGLVSAADGAVPAFIENAGLLTLADEAGAFGFFGGQSGLIGEIFDSGLIWVILIGAGIWFFSKSSPSDVRILSGSSDSEFV